MSSTKLSGIDISYHNGEIDFSKIKSKVDFIIMRAGYGVKTTDSKEIKFDIYYNEAKKYNIPIGTYWYCYAKTPEGALLEAKTFLNKVKGKKFEFPVYYDVEEKALFDTGKENVNAIIKTFCDELEKNNYYCGIYCSSYYFKTFISEEIKQKYEIWVAHWGVDKPIYEGKWGIWQYSSKGHLDGIQSRYVDLDTAIINYEPIIKKIGKNGYEINSQE